MAALEENEDAEDIFDPGLFLNEDYAEHSYELGDGARQTCLCLEGASVSVGRALLIPTAIMHQASRIEATFNKKDEVQKAFWQGLGFEIHDGFADISVDNT